MDIKQKLENFCQENGIVLQPDITFDDEGLDSTLKYAVYGLLIPTKPNRESRLKPIINIAQNPTPPTPHFPPPVRNGEANSTKKKTATKKSAI